MEAYIYALTDNGAIFYIGKTANLAQRFKQHISHSVRLWNEKDKRIQEILLSGRKLDYIVLKRVDPNDALEVEMDSIKEHISEGHPLLNCMVYKATRKPNDIVAGLTKKQRQVLIYLSQDKDTEEIAALLLKSPRTIETIRQNIKMIAGVKTLTGLMVWAINNDIVPI